MESHKLEMSDRVCCCTSSSKIKMAMISVFTLLRGLCVPMSILALLPHHRQSLQPHLTEIWRLETGEESEPPEREVGSRTTIVVTETPNSIPYIECRHWQGGGGGGGAVCECVVSGAGSA
jgi:hypothetical protein